MASALATYPATDSPIDGDHRADLLAWTGPNNELWAYRNQGWWT
jgi:hypothetical protein